jgi:hypothetical protein
MGRPFDAKRYRDVLRACCMLKDVRGMPHGDQTILADRGVGIPKLIKIERVIRLH